MRNLYKVLGITATADDLRIKAAFRRRAKAVHPDLNPDNDRAVAHFIELVQAYEVLSGTETRAAYDTHLAERRREARRRFVHCAGLMAASFVVTTASALLVLGLSGAHVPLRQTWEVAAAALSPPARDVPAPAAKPVGAGWTIEVATAAAVVPAGTTPTASSGQQAPSRPTAWGVKRPKRPNATAAASTPAAPSSWKVKIRTHRLKAETPVSRRVAAVPRRTPRTSLRTSLRTSPAGNARTEPASQSLWSWLTAPPPERRYSLGASDVRP